MIDTIGSESESESVVLSARPQTLVGERERERERETGTERGRERSRRINYMLSEREVNIEVEE